MQSTLSGDATSPTSDIRLCLRTEVIDALMKAQGATSIAEQARRFGINRQHYFEMRRREDPAVPNLTTAMRMAREARTTVEALWGVAA